MTRGHAAGTVFGLDLSPLTLGQVVDLAGEAVTRRTSLRIGVLNAAKVAGLAREPLLRDSLLSSDLLLADGQSVVWASRLLGHPVPERVAGIDLFEALLALADRRGLRVFLLGATPEVIDRTCRAVSRRWPGAILCGRHDGYFTDDHAAEVAEEIAASGADLLFVAMSTPKKELFLWRHGRQVGVPVQHGVGGAFDVLAGVVRRAPLRWQRLGLEWVYRWGQEPGRLWRRYLVTNTVFVGLVVRELVRPREPYPLPLAPSDATLPKEAR